MTALPQPIPADEVAAIMDDQRRADIRIVAEAHIAPMPFTRPMCHCGTARATMSIRSDAARYRAAACDACGEEAIAVLAPRGDVIVERYRKTGDDYPRPMGVLMAEGLLDEEDEPELCRHCNTVLTDENTHPRLGCCVDCREIAYDEYMRYGRAD